MMMDQNAITVVPGNPSSDRRCPDSGSGSVKWTTGHDGVEDQAPHGNDATGPPPKIKLRKQISFGTWNVRGLLHTGKLNILERELDLLKIDICGVCETHWRGKGHFSTKRHNIYISGREERGQSGVAIIVNKRIARSVISYDTISDRVISVKLAASPMNLNLIQVYMPTGDATDEEVDAVYGTIEDVIRRIPNKEQLIVTGDFNAKVGQLYEHQLKSTVGRFGLGVRNERGERFVQFAVENNLSISNTMFENHPRRLSTWTSPDKRYHNQIDYILVRRRWRSSIKNVRARPGADCDSDHKLLWGSLAVKLKTLKKENKPVRITVRNTKTFQQKLGGIANVEAHVDADSMWKTIKQRITEAARDSGPTMVQRSKHWMSEATLQMVDERRLAKSRNGGEDEVRIDLLNRSIKQACKKDKNEFIKTVCEKLENHAIRSESHELFQTVKYLTREFRPQTQAVMDAQGRRITDPVGIAATWREYCTQLYKEDDDLTITHMGPCDLEPYILRAEIERAISRLKNKKAPGHDGITAEVLRAMGPEGEEALWKLCNKIWSTGVWPNDWAHSTFVPIYKKGSPLDCSNYRTVALIPHASKIVLYVVNERLKSFLLPEIAEEQAGFVAGRGTREQILNIRQIIEKAREFNIKTYLCFVDYTKAFDSVKWPRLWSTLLEMGVPSHLVKLIRGLYEANTTTVRVGTQTSEPFSTQTGTRQGCILSPLLFNAYTETIMRKVLDNWQGGISVGGRKISNLRYADDTLLLAGSAEELTEIMRELERISREYGLEINRAKTKVMIIDRRNENLPAEPQVAGFDTVSSFVYLGSLLSSTGGSSGEIKRRLAMARSATSNLAKIWKNRSITKNTKLRLINALIFPIATYAAETWTMRKADRKRVEAFEMWVYRRILRVSWVEHRTNVSILEELGVKNRLLKRVGEAYLRYFGHIARQNGTMANLIVEGKVEGRRSRGRSPSRWVDQLRNLVGGSLPEAAHLARDRSAWRSIVTAATPCQGQ
jgi:exonuclease III